jgi:hypothetical protein
MLHPDPLLHPVQYSCARDCTTTITTVEGVLVSYRWIEALSMFKYDCRYEDGNRYRYQERF